MTDRKRNQKQLKTAAPRNAGGRPGRSGLYLACFRAGLSVKALATQIGSPRNMLYLAWEKPSRYSRLHRKIQNALS